MTARRGPDSPGHATEILTFLIADIRGYTAYTQSRGDETAARLAAKFAEIMREGVEARGGSVIELRGDEALAVFQSARQALRAAIDLQMVFADETRLDPLLPLGVGIGIDAGEAVPVEGGYRGGALNLAARLCSQAGASEVLASSGVVHLARATDGLRFEERGRLELKGLDEAVDVVRVLPSATLEQDAAVAPVAPVSSDSAGAPSGSNDFPAELDAGPFPLVGRDPEIRWLRWNWRLARRGPARLLLIGGEAGSGKTRLAAELAATARADGASIAYAAGETNKDGVGRALSGRAFSKVGPDEPALVVFDEVDQLPLDLARDLSVALAEVAGRRRLVVCLARDADAVAVHTVVGVLEATQRRDLGSLDAEAVRAIAALYTIEDANRVPAQEILRATGGRAATVMRAVGAWASAEATKRLGDAAGRTATGRSDLQALETELAGTVVELQLMRERARTLVVSDPADESPFKGLATFEVEDAEVFFGRERLVADMVARLPGSTLLAIVGPSGSGKSSAVRAGLVPALAAGVLPGSETWLRALFRPGAHPLRELDRAVWGAIPHDMRDQLGGTDLPLRGLLRGVLAEHQRILIAVDQFEEAIALCPDEDERLAFVQALVEAVNDETHRVVVILTLRADFYGRCAAYPELAALLAANHLLVGEMRAEEYRRAIEMPARRAGLRFDPSVVDALVEDVVDEPGGLPLLSTALLELWEHRESGSVSIAIYARTGGVRGAVARLAEAAFADLSERQQTVLRAIMLRLAGPGEGDVVVRRRVPLTEFDNGDSDVSAVVAALIDRRLVRVSEGTVEVAHEALLREWPRVRQWLEEDRQGQRLHQHMIAAAKGWDLARRDPGELYRGTRLASALDWTTEHTLELNELERTFVSESRAAAERDVERQRGINRRLRGLLAGAAIFLVVALAAGSVALVLRGRAEQATIEAQADLLGAEALSQSDLVVSILLAREGLNLDDSTATENNLIATLLRSPSAIGVTQPLPGRYVFLQAALRGNNLFIGSNTGKAAVVDAATRRVVATFEDDLDSLGADGQHVLVGKTDPKAGSVALAQHELASGASTELATVPPGLLGGGAFSVSGDLRTLALAPDPGDSLILFDTTTGRMQTVHAPHGIAFFDVAIAPDDRHFVTLDQAADGSIAFAWWMIGSSKPLRVITPIGPGGASYAIGPDSRSLASGGQDGSVTVYDTVTGKPRVLQGHENAAVSAIAFSLDGKLLATGGDDQRVVLWDLQSGLIRQTLSGHGGSVHGVAFSPDSSTLYSAGLDGNMFVWDVSGRRQFGSPFQVSPGMRDLVSGAPPANGPAQVFPRSVLSPDGKTLAVAQEDGTVAMLDATTLRLRTTIRVSHGPVLALAFSPTGTALAVSAWPQSVSLWVPQTGQRLSMSFGGIADSVGGQPNPLRSLAFSADGSVLLGGDSTGHIYRWNAQTGNASGPPLTVPAEPLRASPPAVLGLAISPNGTDLAAAYGSKAAVWRMADAMQLETVDVDGGYGLANALAFSPDNAELATGGGDGYLRIYDAQTGHLVGEPQLVNAGWVLSIAYSSDGKHLVTGGSDGTVRLFDAGTRAQIGAPFPGGIGATDWSVGMLSPDGTRIYAMHESGQGNVWDIGSGALADRACKVAGRNLTRGEWNEFLPSQPYGKVCAHLGVSGPG